MNRLLCILVAGLILLSGCSERNGQPVSAPVPSSSIPPSSQEPESSSVPVSSSKPESKPEEEVPEEFSLPILTEAERALLLEELAVFVGQVGGVNLKNAAEIDPAAALPAILAEIDRSRDLNGYFFSKNSSGQEMISEKLVQETATRMFGISVFPQLESYDLTTQAYPYTPAQAATGYTVADPVGAPGDALTYTVTLDTGVAYLYTCKIVRVNSIPYLQLQSIQRVNE